jgi:hypothetical protein
VSQGNPAGALGTQSYDFKCPGGPARDSFSEEVAQLSSFYDLSGNVADLIRRESAFAHRLAEKPRGRNVRTCNPCTYMQVFVRSSLFTLTIKQLNSRAIFDASSCGLSCAAGRNSAALGTMGASAAAPWGASNHLAGICR